MAEISPNRKTLEEIRAERIAAVTQPHVRTEIDKLINDRDAKLAQINERHVQGFDKDVAYTMASRADATRNPNYRGPAWPAHRAAAIQAVQIKNRAELDREAKPYNERIDKRLDRYDRSVELQQHMKTVNREVVQRNLGRGVPPGREL